MDSTSNQLPTGYISRMTNHFAIPLSGQHSVSVWLMLLALGVIAVLAWKHVLKYVQS